MLHGSAVTLSALLASVDGQTEHLWGQIDKWKNLEGLYGVSTPLN